MAIKTFEKGSSTYKCQSCGKVTRNTHGERWLGICAKCEELGAIENSWNDGEIDDAEYDAAVAEVNARYA